MDANSVRMKAAPGRSSLFSYFAVVEQKAGVSWVEYRDQSLGRRRT